jgi:hypothetical protein
LTLGSNGGEFGVVANPKSANLAVELAERRIFAGLISRWIIP